MSLSARAPAHSATRGPPPGGSSWTAGSPETPGPTSMASVTTACRTNATLTAQRTPPIGMEALSNPIRLLAPPVSRIPVMGVLELRVPLTAPVCRDELEASIVCRQPVLLNSTIKSRLSESGAPGTPATASPHFGER
jgi:hypothetical protein